MGNTSSNSHEEYLNSLNAKFSSGENIYQLIQTVWGRTIEESPVVIDIPRLGRKIRILDKDGVRLNKKYNNSQTAADKVPTPRHPKPGASCPLQPPDFPESTDQEIVANPGEEILTTEEVIRDLLHTLAVALEPPAIRQVLHLTLTTDTLPPKEKMNEYLLENFKHEQSPTLCVLKAANQAIIAPAVTFMKQKSFAADLRYRDVRQGWKISVLINCPEDQMDFNDVVETPEFAQKTASKQRRSHTVFHIVDHPEAEIPKKSESPTSFPILASSSGESQRLSAHFALLQQRRLRQRRLSARLNGGSPRPGSPRVPPRNASPLTLSMRRSSFGPGSKPSTPSPKKSSPLSSPSHRQLFMGHSSSPKNGSPLAIMLHNKQLTPSLKDTSPLALSGTPPQSNHFQPIASQSPPNFDFLGTTPVSFHVNPLFRKSPTRSSLVLLPQSSEAFPDVSEFLPRSRRLSRAWRSGSITIKPIGSGGGSGTNRVRRITRRKANNIRLPRNFHDQMAALHLAASSPSATGVEEHHIVARDGSPATTQSHRPNFFTRRARGLSTKATSDQKTDSRSVSKEGKAKGFFSRSRSRDHVTRSSAENPESSESEEKKAKAKRKREKSEKKNKVKTEMLLLAGPIQKRRPPLPRDPRFNMVVVTHRKMEKSATAEPSETFTFTWQLSFTLLLPNGEKKDPPSEEEVTPLELRPQMIAMSLRVVDYSFDPSMSPEFKKKVLGFFGSIYIDEFAF